MRLLRMPVLAVAAVAVVAAGAVIVTATRGGCTLDDAPPRPAGAATPAADLTVLGFGPATHATAVGHVETLLATPQVDVVVTNGRDDTPSGAVVLGLDPVTGARRWSVGAPGNGVSVAVVQGRLVGVTRTDRLRVFGLDLATGADRWCHERGAVADVAWWSPADRVPLAAAGTRAVLAWRGPDRAGTLTAVDAATGDVAWEVAGDADRLVAAGDRVVTGSGVAHALADGAATGPALDRAELVAADPDHVVLRHGTDLSAVDRAGRVEWTAPDRGSGDRPDTLLADGVVVDNVVAEVGDRSGLQGLDARTGRQLWRSGDNLLGGRRFRAAAVAAGRAVVAGEDAVGVYDPRTGETRATAAPGPVVAVAADPTGRLALVTDGTLASYPPR